MDHHKHRALLKRQRHCRRNSGSPPTAAQGVPLYGPTGANEPRKNVYMAYFAHFMNNLHQDGMFRLHLSVRKENVIYM